MILNCISPQNSRTLSSVVLRVPITMDITVIMFPNFIYRKALVLVQFFAFFYFYSVGIFYLLNDKFLSSCKLKLGFLAFILENFHVKSNIDVYENISKKFLKLARLFFCTKTNTFFFLFSEITAFPIMASLGLFYSSTKVQSAYSTAHPTGPPRHVGVEGFFPRQRCSQHILHPQLTGRDDTHIKNNYIHKKPQCMNDVCIIACWQL